MNKLIIYILIAIMNTSLIPASTDFEILDVGTLQTKSSTPIALNNAGQILGLYNIDGTEAGKHCFVRDRDGTFHEIPTKTPDLGIAIDWQFLTDHGTAYGTSKSNASSSTLYTWDSKNGFSNLGDLPGREVCAVNNSGQVLIKSVTDTIEGKSTKYPVIWQNGNVTKLQGLEGNIGIESESSYAMDLNNIGEVVGSSLVNISYKNTIYQQWHAVKWINGKAIDLHCLIPKSTDSKSSAINDLGELIVNGHLIKQNGLVIYSHHYNNSKTTNEKYFYNDSEILDNNKNAINIRGIVNSKLNKDYESLWYYCGDIISVNDKGEALGDGVTIFGEHHIMLLVPADSH